MALTNNLKTQVDLPVFEWMRFAPVNSSNLTCLTTARDGSSRYLYYFGSNILYRYDTIGDSWQQLSTNATPVSIFNVKYVKNQGYRGQVLSATSTTVQLPSTGVDLTGYEIEIYAGTGKGQRRTIQSTNTEVIHDMGLATTAGANSITDTTRRYKFNEWEGYGLRVIFNTGFSQYREIIYNTNDTLTVFDANYEGRNFLMAPFSSTAPYATPNATAGTQADFVIVSQTVNLTQAWDTTPDTSSKFRILSHGIWWVTSNASTPFFTFYYYDILSDRFVQKLSPSGIFPVALATDVALAPINNLVGTYFTGSITSLTSQSITDSSLSMTLGDWVGTEIEIISGSGIGQGRRIFANTTDTFTFGRGWDEMPTTSSKYAVTGEESIYLVGNGRAQMVKYHPERSLWSTGIIVDNGIPFNLVLQKSDILQSQGVTTATRVTNGITGINPVPTLGGIDYRVGDLLNIVTGGTLGRVRVESVNEFGAVLSVSLYSAGSGYSVGTGRGTSTVAGTGVGCTIEITSVGTIGVITTAINHDFVIGDTVTFKGATEAAWNSTYTVNGIQSLTVIEFFNIAATSAAVARYAHSTSTLVDETQKWTPNVFAGKLLCVQSNGLTGAATWRRIIGNSETVIDFSPGVAPTNGNSRYFIQELDAFGKDEQYLPSTQLSYGYASTATTRSLTDNTKNWPINAYKNHKVQITLPTGESYEDIIIYNTTSSLFFGRTVYTSGNSLYANETYGSGSIYTTNDTTLFTNFTGKVCWTGTRFVAVGGGANTVVWSPNGVYWYGLGPVAGSTLNYAIAWNGYKLMTGGFVGAASSIDGGQTWTSIPNPISSSGGVTQDIAWNGTTWVSVGSGTTTISYASDTGSVAFTASLNSPFVVRGRGVCWAGSQWVAVGTGSNTWATSSDGVTWSGGGLGPFPGRPNIYQAGGVSVAWNGKITLMGGSGSAGHNIAYSFDSGSTWTGGGLLPSITGSVVSLIWNGTYWVAGGNIGASISEDGINWSQGNPNLYGHIGAASTRSPNLIPSVGYIPVSGSSYKILDSSGQVTTGTTTTIFDTNKTWKVNQWAGKRLLIVGGAGASQETTISSNTSASLTFTAVTTAPDSGSSFTILGRPVTGLGTTVEWNWSSSIANDKGKQLISPRGGTSHTFDIYDLRTNNWKYGMFILGQGETLTTGTMYAYDGDRVYFQKDATGRIYYYDFIKNDIRPFATIPYGMGTAQLSNRMEIVQTVDGLKYLYIMRHSTNEMWRTLIYY